MTEDEERAKLAAEERVAREDARIMEKEANYFAMCLLMPEEWVRRDVEKMGGIDIEDDTAMNKLAKKYRVSTTMMVLRLGQLGALKTL